MDYGQAVSHIKKYIGLIVIEDGVDFVIDLLPLFLLEDPPSLFQQSVDLGVFIVMKLNSPSFVFDECHIS